MGEKSNSPQMARVTGKRMKVPDAPPVPAVRETPTIKLPYLRFLDRANFYPWEKVR